MSYVVCIAGTSGAGKTTLTRALARRCNNALIVSFDDYAYAPPTVLPDALRWVAEGADPAAWQVPKLTADLSELRQGGPVHHPQTKQATIPTPIIVVEEPFGRSRPEFAALIDFVAVLDTPLEVALARRLLRELRCGEKSEPGGPSSRHIDFLEGYLNKHSSRETLWMISTSALRPSLRISSNCGRACGTSLGEHRPTRQGKRPIPLVS